MTDEPVLNLVKKMKIIFTKKTSFENQNISKIGNKKKHELHTQRTGQAHWHGGRSCCGPPAWRCFCPPGLPPQSGPGCSVCLETSRDII